MAETSRSRVTITLGRSGQVIKKAGPAVGDGSFSDSLPSIGSKRSIRDRVGSNLDSTAQMIGKRQRQEGSRFSISSTNDMDDMSLSKDDLRFKIMHKSNLNKSQRNNQQNGVDLRDMLSRPAQSSTTSVGARQHGPELKDTAQQLPELRAGRQQMPEPRNGKQLMTEHQDSWQRQPEPRDVRHLMLDLKDGRLLWPGPNGSSILGQFPSTKSADSLLHTGSLKNSYSPWTLDSLRRRSPDRFLGTSRDFSPPRRDQEQERKALLREYDDSRITSYRSKNSYEHSHLMKSTPYNTKTAQTAGPARSMAPFLGSVPSVSHGRKSSYVVDDHSTVDSFLHSLGLDKYAINFKAEEVDMYALRQMGDNDLKELGIPMGPRKKIVLTLLSCSKRQP